MWVSSCQKVRTIKQLPQGSELKVNEGGVKQVPPPQTLLAWLAKEILLK